MTSEDNTTPLQNGRSPHRLLTIFTGRTIPPVPEVPEKYPEPDASIFSRLTFSWITPLLTVSAHFRYPFEDDQLSVGHTLVEKEGLALLFNCKIRQLRQEHGLSRSKSADVILVLFLWKWTQPLYCTSRKSLVGSIIGEYNLRGTIDQPLSSFYCSTSRKGSLYSHIGKSTFNGTIERIRPFLFEHLPLLETLR